MEAIAKIREKRHTACLDLQQWHTTCIADILKPETPWAFRAKLAGQARGSAQDVEAIPLYEAADNLSRCVEDQRRRGLPDAYSNLNIAIVDAVQMSALVPTAELKQPGQFVCSLNIVSMLFVARGLAHNRVERFHDVCLLCWSRSCEGSAEVPRKRGESHEERAEETGRDPPARVLQESGRRDAGRKNNSQILAEFVRQHHP